MAVSSLLRPPGTLLEPQFSRPAPPLVVIATPRRPSASGGWVVPWGGIRQVKARECLGVASAGQARRPARLPGAQKQNRPLAEALRGCQTPSSHPGGNQPLGPSTALMSPCPSRESVTITDPVAPQQWDCGASEDIGLLPPPPLCPSAWATSLSRLLPHLKPPPQPFFCNACYSHVESGFWKHCLISSLFFFCLASPT